MLLPGPRISCQKREDDQVTPGSFSQIHIRFSLFDIFDWRFRLKIVTQLQAGSSTSDAGSCVIMAGRASCPYTVRMIDHERRRRWATLDLISGPSLALVQTTSSSRHLSCSHERMF